MTTTPAPAPGQPLPPPLLVIPATGLMARPINGAAEVVLYGGPEGMPLVQASIALTREQLLQLSVQLVDLAEQLPAAGPQLVTPPSGLVVPGRG